MKAWLPAWLLVAALAAGCGSAPTGPATPSAPATSTAPSNPSNPSNPTTPSNPSNPSNRSNPSNPSTPSTPSSTPTTFAVKDGKTSIIYGDQAFPTQYETVVHYRCCSAGAYNNGGNEQMAWFFGKRDGRWYYVELSKHD